MIRDLFRGDNRVAERQVRPVATGAQRAQAHKVDAEWRRVAPEANGPDGRKLSQLRRDESRLYKGGGRPPLFFDVQGAVFARVLFG